MDIHSLEERITELNRRFDEHEQSLREIRELLSFAQSRHETRCPRCGKLVPANALGEPEAHYCTLRVGQVQHPDPNHIDGEPE